jgi:hypothetical protein
LEHLKALSWPEMHTQKNSLKFTDFILSLQKFSLKLSTAAFAVDKLLAKIGAVIVRFVVIRWRGADVIILQWLCVGLFWFF